MIVDMGSGRHGWERLTAGKPHHLVLVPVSEDMPPQPDRDHYNVGAVRIITPSLGRCDVIVDTDAIAEAFTRLHGQYIDAEQAQRGLLPIVLFADRSLDFEIIDWEGRDERYFGSRLIPPPG